MSDQEVVEYRHYYPSGVQRVFATGTSAFIGEVDGSTVLKYPLESGGDRIRLEHQHKILILVGQHRRIIAQKGLTDVGLYLERVIHCDIQPTNILVDNDLHLKLADFQGNYISEHGEPCRYFCPRDDEFEANSKTDIFALGSTIYFIMTGHEVFPDIVSGEDGWQERIKSRFASGVLPNDPPACDVES